MPGIIKSIQPDGAAAQAGLRAGDGVRALNGHALRDVIDAQFYAAEPELAFEIERDGERMVLRAEREFGQELGIEFEHPTFDIDIRRCNNLCPFCFVLQNAQHMRRTLYIKDDDYRYSFLFGHFVTLTNLLDEDWARLAEQRLSPLYVSVHCTDTAIRQKCLRNPNAKDVLEQLRWLARHDIQAHTQLVITPGLNDGAWLEKSVHDLAALYPDVMSVSVVPVGLTAHHKYGYRPHTPAECAAVIERVQAWQTEFRKTLGVGFVHCTDEWYLVAGKPLPPKRSYDGLSLEENGMGMVRNFLNEWAQVKRKELHSAFPPPAPPGGRGVNAVLATATLFAPVLQKTAAEFTQLTGVPLRAVPITNTRLGASITVAGLLMGRDIIEQLRPVLAAQPASVVVLPRVTFDHPDGISLDDITPLQIARELGAPVALADWMGDVVDALKGENKLTFYPDAAPSATPIVREGGWAVEKYL
jgi:putative radical SAM enzyme (TIGR03279 family)